MIRPLKIAATVTVAALLWTLNVVSGQPIEGRARKHTMAAMPMYTMDYAESLMPFSFISDFMMKVAALHGIDEDAPKWDTDFSLHFRGAAAMKGFVAMEYALFDPSKHSLGGLEVHSSGDLCHRREDIENDIESTVDFVDWEWDQSQSQNFVHFNSTHPVHSTGLWVNIIHLCVTEGQHHDDSHSKHHGHGHRGSGWRSLFHHHSHSDFIRVTMRGHFTAFNPLGLLGGNLLMALPVLFSVGVIYIVMALIWSILMIKHRSNNNLIWSVHGTLLLGIILLFADTLWDYTKFWSINHDGFHPPSINLMILHQSISNMLSLYIRIAAMIISTGTGIARPSLGKKMMRFLAIYGVIFCAVNGRIEWIEFDLFQSRWSYRPDGFGFGIDSQLNVLFKLQTALDFVFAVMTCFNVTATLLKLQREQQFHKNKLFRRLIAITAFCICSTAALSFAATKAQDTMQIADPSNWAILYLLDDGFWRFVHLGSAIAILSVLRPHQHSSRMAYSAQIPSGTNSNGNGTDGIDGTEDVDVDDEAISGDVVTPNDDDHDENQKSSSHDIDSRSWDDMFAAVRGIGPWIMNKIRPNRSSDHDDQ